MDFALEDGTAESPLWESRAALRPSAPGGHLARLTRISSFPVVEPGAPVTITFTLKNSGIATWAPQDDALVHVGGERFGLAATVAAPSEIPPNKTWDLKFDFAAPTNPGVYTSEWQMHSKGQTYGSRVFFSVVVLTKSQQSAGGLIRSFFGQLWKDTVAQITELENHAKAQANEHRRLGALRGQRPLGGRRRPGRRGRHTLVACAGSQ